LIFGITGQTGSYLTEHLRSLGNIKDTEYIVHGVIRRTSLFNTGRLEGLFDHPSKELHYGDILDPLFVIQIIAKLKPDEIYNLAAQSHVQVSFANPCYTVNVDAMGVVNILEAVRILEMTKSCRIYQAGTSEMYGGDRNLYNEATW